MVEKQPAAFTFSSGGSGSQPAAPRMEAGGSVAGGFIRSPHVDCRPLALPLSLLLNTHPP